MRFSAAAVALLALAASAAQAAPVVVFGDRYAVSRKSLVASS